MDLKPILELKNLVQVRKNQKMNLSPFLPQLTWVVQDSEIDECLHLERELSKTEDEISDNVKSAILALFKNRDCVKISDFDIKTSVEIKKIAGKTINGAILCNMAQAYAHRFHKSAPAVIFGAFERAVAAEARRIKEKLFIRYIDKMSLIESELPCEDEHLLKEHQSIQKELIKEFDLNMINVFEQEEVQDERSSLLDRTEGYFEDLKGSNMKASETKCREIFKNIFEPLRADGLKYLEDGTANISELEQKFILAIQNYQNQSSGPMIESVFAEEIAFLVPYMCSLLRDVHSYFETSHEDLEREIKTLTRNLSDAKLNEKRMKDVIDENAKNFGKEMELRDKQIAEIQAGVNNRIYIAENKVKVQLREIQGLKLELEQSQKEREMMIEAEREIFAKRNSDLESKLYKLQSDNNKYEKLLDELRDELEKTIAEKNEQINDLSRRIKLMETHESPSPRQDASILRSFKEYLEDIYNKLTKEQNANAKYLSQLERVAALQNELNQLRLREQETKNILIDEYEEKVRELKSERDKINKKFTELLEKSKDDQRPTADSFTCDIEKYTKINTEREIEIKRLMEEKLELSSELAKREQQLSDQQEVIDAHKKTLEQSQFEIDERDNLINRLKIENVEERDDNDILINLMGATLEMQQRKRHVQTIRLSRIQNQENRIKVAKIFKKYGVPYE